MRTSSWLMTALLGLPPLLGAPPPAHGQTTLADIIASVRRNEKLYDNIEVVMDSTYDIGDRKPQIENEVIGFTDRIIASWIILERNLRSGETSARNASGRALEASGPQFGVKASW